MLNHTVCVYPRKYTSKPTKEDIKERSTGINDDITNHPKYLSVKELAEVCINGQTYLAGFFEGQRNNKSWKGQSLFVLDFDNTKQVSVPSSKEKLKVQVDNPITLEDVLGRLREYGLDCVFAYNTFSHSNNWHKFRVVFQLNYCIICNSFREGIQLALLELFPEADRCKDACRLWHGTNKEVTYENYDYTLDVESLLLAVSMFSTKNVKPKHLSQRLSRLERKFAKCVKSGSSFNKYKEGSRYHTDLGTKPELLKVDWDYLRSEVRILDDFMRGEWLYHMDLFGLATNLIHIHGGSKLFKECLDLNPNYTQDKYHLTAIARYYEYSPMRLENFSPYEEDWFYNNLLRAARKGKVVRLEPYQAISLKEAEVKLNNAIREALEDASNSIWIIKKATALGGTESLLDLEEVTIALPNHALKSEISGRLRAEHLVTPELPFDSINPELAKRLKHLFSIGSYGIALDLVKDESVKNDALAKYWIVH